MLKKQKISRLIISLVILAVSLTSLTACEDFLKKNKELSFEDERLIDRDPTFSRTKFMEESKERSLEESQYGPKVESTAPLTDKDRYRKLINKEENFNYTDIDELEKANFKTSLNAENMDIRTFADMLSTITGVNILISDEVNGNVTAKLKDVLWTSMLDSVLSTKKLAKHIDSKSNIIRIHDQGTVVQLEDFEEKRKENVQRSIYLKKASEPTYTEIFKLFYTKPEQIKKQIEEILINKNTAGTSQTYRNIDPELSIDERKNLLIAKARKEDMEIISKLVTELDTRTQQIFIEAFVVEVDDNFEQQFGTRFGVSGTDDFTNVIDNKDGIATIGGVAGSVSSTTTLGDSTNTISNLPVTAPFGGIGILTGIGSSADLKVELSAMETQGLSKVISNPRIFTLDNQEAVIFQGDEVPYETVSQDGTQIQFKEAGLKLSVVPTIIGDGNLQLNIQVNKDTVDTTISNPPITKSEIKTNLVTKDGEIVVMGGIYTQTNNKTKDKVPGLADIPGVGHLFRRDADEDTRKELIIFIAPKIL